VALGSGGGLAAAGAESRSFTNPVVASGADPWVVRHGSYYYFCQSGGRQVRVARSERLRDLGADRGTVVWSPPSGTPYSKEIWAPELHYLQDRWWIYVAADDGTNAHHRMFVLEGTSNHPLAPFVLKTRLAAPTDRWAIDGTVLVMPDQSLYFIWSGWEAFDNVAQHLYIAPMSNPWTISGERVRISSPEHEWERRGTPHVNEGPQALWNGNQLFLIYSASGSWTDDYCLGQLKWTGGNPLDPRSWVKHPQPVFARTTAVFGPGHCSFVRSRDHREDWIIYHSAKHSGAGWNRRINMQRFTWRPDGTPDFGVPIAAGVPQAEPSGNSLP
jgi:GH43 family beta-xylosidase